MAFRRNVRGQGQAHQCQGAAQVAEAPEKNIAHAQVTIKRLEMKRRVAVKAAERKLNDRRRGSFARATDRC